MPSAGLQVVADDDDFDDELPRRAPVGEYNELPVYGVPPPDRVYLLESILQELERGVFRQAALLCDSMLRDDRVNAVIQTRVNAVLGAPQEWEASDEETGAQKICDELQKAWPKIAGPAEVSELLRWALLLGVGVGELVWTRQDTNDGPRVMPRLKVWHPQFLYWIWNGKNGGQYWIITSDGAIPITLNTGEWVLLTPYGYNRAWLRGLVRSLARPWMIRNWTFRDAARRSEIYGQGIRQLIAPAKADEKTKKRLEGQLANIGNETTITTPQGEEGNRWDVKIVEATAQGFEAFFKLIEECNSSIAIDALGQNLTTEVKGGSRAAAQVQNSVRGDLMAFDAETLARSDREQILEPYCRFNHGDAELAPTKKHITDPADDGAALAKEQFDAMNAATLMRPLSIPLDVRAYAETHKIPLLAGSDEQIKLPEPAPEPDPNAPPMKKPGQAKPAEGQPPKGKL